MRNKDLQKIQSNLAEPKSGYPETVEQVRELRIRSSSLKANQVEGILFLLSVQGSVPDWESDKIYGTMAQLSYRYKYEGEWKIVQELLETKLQTPEDFYLIYTKYHSPEAFFGNLIKEAYYLQRIGVLEYIHPRSVSEDRRQVHRKVRRRGYSDKGTLRFRHEQHGEPYIPPKKEREDRRSKVSNRLTQLEFREQTNFRDGD